MGFWTTILRGGGRAVASAGDAIIHPQRTLIGAGKAVKTAAVGGAVGYVGWEKLTTDKSVTRIVSDAVIGSDTTDAIADTVSDVKELKTKAGEAVDAVNGVASNMSGIGNFMHNISTGNVGDMFGNLFSNITSGKVGESARTRGSSVYDLRTLRLAQQDCRCASGNVHYRQQLQSAGSGEQ